MQVGLIVKWLNPKLDNWRLTGWSLIESNGPRLHTCLLTTVGALFIAWLDRVIDFYAAKTSDYFGFGFPNKKYELREAVETATALVKSESPCRC